MKVSKQGLMIIVTLLAVVVSGWLVLPHAHAQAKLASSNPADGSVLNAAPPDVEVKFGEDLEPNGSTVTVKYKQDADAPEQDAVAGKVEFPDRDTMRIVLKNLGEGSYVVSWKAISERTQKDTEGEFDFKVSKTAAPSSGSTTGAAADPDKSSSSSGNDSESRGTLIMLIVLGVAAVVGIASAVMLKQRAVRH